MLLMNISGQVNGKLFKVRDIHEGRKVRANTGYGAVHGYKE